jgi:hypothetical protein
MDPIISGDTRVDMFNNEFRVRLSWMISPVPSTGGSEVFFRRRDDDFMLKFELVILKFELVILI